MGVPSGQVVPISIAALPMYDFPELGDAHDRLWGALAHRLRNSGIAGVPRQLTRRLSHREVWSHPGLLFGQACEYPVSKSFRRHLRILATPRYCAPGCDRYTYRSAIVVRAGESAESLGELRERRCVVNEPDSNSGMNLRHALETVCADPALTAVRTRLLLESVDFTPDTTFGRVLELEQQAERWRYPALL